MRVDAFVASSFARKQRFNRPINPAPFCPRDPIHRRLPAAIYRHSSVTFTVPFRGGYLSAYGFLQHRHRATFATLLLQCRRPAKAETLLPRAQKTLRGNVQINSE
jgi:hypothetical protein